MKFYFIIILMLTVGVSSCKKDYLTKNPLESPSSGTFFSNERELTLAINGAYRELYWLSNNVPVQLFLDGATDLSYIRGDYVNMLSIQSGQITTETGVFESAWKHFYVGIARCNNILDNMHKAKENVSESIYNRIQAEALFLRAFHYSYLINLYGDVPFVKKMLQLDEAYMSRTPKSEIVDQLLIDLDLAAENLPKKYTNGDIGRVTKGAAYALKARIAIYDGRYAEAAKAAKAVMDLNTYTIYSNYENLFKHKGVNSDESILVLPFLQGVQINEMPRYLGLRSSSGYSVIVPTQTVVDMYQCTDGKRIDESPLYDPANPYANRDPRLAQSILRPGMWFNGYLFETHPDAITTQRNVNGTISTVGNPVVTNAFATFTGYIWKKYLDEEDVKNNLVTRSELSFILIRYAEVLLTYAEAKIELNEVDQSVINAINDVRRRPNVLMPAATIGMDIEELRDLIRYERTIELAVEGFRLFDIRRWKIAEHVLPGNVLGRRTKDHWNDEIVPSFNAYGKPTYANERDIFQIISENQFSKKHYLWPVPQKQKDLNPALGQNPDWQ